jgi:hypothetical protein
MKSPLMRKGFTPKIIVLEQKNEASLLPLRKEPLVYWNSKLTHTGIVAYKSFENIYRKSSKNSLANLINNGKPRINEVQKWLNFIRICKTVKIKKMLLEVSKEQLFENEYNELLRMSLNSRNLSITQSRKLKNEANKLNYYSGTRHFTTKKSGHYTFRTAFLTLTAPENASNIQIKKAFENFCLYLTRTANCVYVWKKELGEENSRFHIHLLINNIIPYYIVSWKWRKCLQFEGVQWSLNDKGKLTDSHYRIELPKNKKHAAHYISKYMSKAYAIPRVLGYIWGCSDILRSLKEIVLIENEIDMSEVAKLRDSCKTICDQFITIICVNLLNIEKWCPNIHAVFQSQYVDFTQKITLRQKFHVV